MSKSNAKFSETLLEGNVYLVGKFSVSRNLADYRATTHPFKIGLSMYTQVEMVEANLPTHAYSFMSLTDIIKVKDKKECEHLIGNVYLHNCHAIIKI